MLCYLRRTRICRYVLRYLEDVSSLAFYRYIYYFFVFVGTSLVNFIFFFFLNDPAPPEIYTLPLHDALPILLGPKFSPADRQAINLTRHYSMQQVEYSRNLVFRRNFPIHKLFERSCDIGLLRLTPDKITQILDRKSTRLNSSHGYISYAVFCL